MLNTAKSLSTPQVAAQPEQEITTVIRENDLVGIIGTTLASEIAVVTNVGPAGLNPAPHQTGTVRVKRANGDQTTDIPLIASEKQAIDWLEEVAKSGGSGICAFELPAEVTDSMRKASEKVAEEHMGEIRSRQARDEAPKKKKA